jgi:hypothetical protein
MRECKNNYFAILNGIEDLVREFMDDIPPDFLALGRPCFRILLNAEKGMPDLFLESYSRRAISRIWMSMFIF